MRYPWGFTCKIVFTRRSKFLTHALPLAKPPFKWVPKQLIHPFHCPVDGGPQWTKVIHWDPSSVQKKDKIVPRRLHLVKATSWQHRVSNLTNSAPTYVASHLWVLIWKILYCMFFKLAVRHLRTSRASKNQDCQGLNDPYWQKYSNFVSLRFLWYVYQISMVYHTYQFFDKLFDEF